MTEPVALTEAGKIKRTVASMVLAESPEEVEDRKKLEKTNVLEEFDNLLKCTRCSADYSKLVTKGQQLSLHPLLNVFFCGPCNDFYQGGEFSVDEDEEEKYCRWCGEGGTLFICSLCICGFCPKCIKKNLGSHILRKVKDDDNWKCFICDPKPLWHLRHVTHLAVEHAENVRNRRKSTSSESNGSEDVAPKKLRRRKRGHDEDATTTTSHDEGSGWKTSDGTTSEVTSEKTGTSFSEGPSSSRRGATKSRKKLKILESEESDAVTPQKTRSKPEASKGKATQPDEIRTETDNIKKKSDVRSLVTPCQNASTVKDEHYDSSETIVQSVSPPKEIRGSDVADAVTEAPPVTESQSGDGDKEKLLRSKAEKRNLRQLLRATATCGEVLATKTERRLAKLTPGNVGQSYVKMKQLCTSLTPIIGELLGKVRELESQAQ